jgi:hypothetical protein
MKMYEKNLKLNFKGKTNIGITLTGKILTKILGLLYGRGLTKVTGFGVG